MIEPIWKLLPKQHDTFVDVVFRQWEDGRKESCLVTAKEYLAWLAEGNTPISSDSE
jgi:hypothetical protein